MCDSKCTFLMRYMCLEIFEQCLRAEIKTECQVDVNHERQHISHQDRDSEQTVNEYDSNT